jgi:phosphoribosylglycinamide formyltransferase 1
MEKDFNVLTLISGRGTNLNSLISKCKNVNFIGVVSNTCAAPGLKIASSAQIPTYCFERSEFASLSEFKNAIRKQANALQPDLIVLAGYMQILEPEFIAIFPGRIINIHPSLLPLYPGLHTHERAIKALDQRHGCTVHVVDSGVDTGPIIAQAAVPVLTEDTPDSLALRVLEQEHRLYPWVIDQLAAATIQIADNTVHWDSRAVLQAKEYGFIIPGGHNE